MSEESVWTPVPPDMNDPRIQSALAELRGMILRGFPDAEIEVRRGEDPDGIYMWVTVDLDDPEPVLDLVLERLQDMRVEEGLPIHVVPLTTPKRSRRIYLEEHPEYVPRTSRG